MSILRPKILLPCVALMLCMVPLGARAQYVLGSTDGGNVGKFLLAGGVVQNPFIEELSGGSGIAVANGKIYASSKYDNKIKVFDEDDGDLVGTLISSAALNFPQALAVVDDDLLVVSQLGNQIRHYDIDDGSPIGTGVLVSGLSSPLGIAVANGKIYVTNAGTQSVCVYNLSDGSPVGSGTLVSGLHSPYGIAISGNKLFVSNVNNGRINVYNVNDGTPIGTGIFATGLFGPKGLAVSGNTLVAANNFGSYITTYNIDTGAFIDYIASGVTSVEFVAISSAPIPEPSTVVGLVVGGIMLLVFYLGRRNRNQQPVKMWPPSTH